MIGRKPELRHPSCDCTDCDLRLQARKARAEAVVRPMAERQMLSVGALDVEAVGIGNSAAHFTAAIASISTISPSTASDVTPTIVEAGGSPSGNNSARASRIAE